MSELGDQVDEDASVVQREVGQIVRERPEIVAHTQLEVVSEMAVSGKKRARFARPCLNQLEMAQLEQKVPGMNDMIAGVQDRQPGVVVLIDL